MPHMSNRRTKSQEGKSLLLALIAKREVVASGGLDLLDELERSTTWTGFSSVDEAAGALRALAHRHRIDLETLLDDGDRHLSAFEETIFLHAAVYLENSVDTGWSFAQMRALGARLGRA